MAAYGTKKSNGDLGVQLSFPAVFQQYFDAGYGYFPSSAGRSMQLLVGTDFQSDYHEQKRRDANKTVMDGIQANKTKERLLLTGTANYHVPKAVLGQRRFANPSFGQLGIESARRDGDTGAPFSVVERGQSLRGGVLNTPEGTDFYTKQLRNRVQQLDRINALSLGYTVSEGQRAPTSDNTMEGAPSKINFFIYLRALQDSILQNDLSRFTFESLKDLLKLLFQIAPEASLETLNDAAESINGMVRDIQSLAEYDGESPEETEYILTLQLFIEGMRRYIDEMIRNVNLSEKDKKTLSKSLIKTLGFDSLMRKTSPESVVMTARVGNPRLDQAAEDADDDDDDNDDDDNDGRFDRPAETREDEEAGGMPSAPFAGNNDDPNREAFGRKGRSNLDPPAYFDDEGRDVAPLIPAGSDAVEIPEASTEGLTEALESAIEDSKYAFFEDLTTEDSEKDIEELLNEKGEDPNAFIRVLEDTMENAGFSKGDIATAMQLNGMPMFSSYIARNLSQGRVPPAIRRDRPVGFQPVVRYEEAPDIRAEIEAANTKAELSAIWNRLPAESKRGVKKPHGNTTVAKFKAKLLSIV